MVPPLQRHRVFTVSNDELEERLLHEENPVARKRLRLNGDDVVVVVVNSVQRHTEQLNTPVTALGNERGEDVGSADGIVVQASGGVIQGDLSSDELQHFMMEMIEQKKALHRTLVDHATETRVYFESLNASMNLFTRTLNTFIDQMNQEQPPHQMLPVVVSNDSENNNIDIPPPVLTSLMTRAEAVSSNNIPVVVQNIQVTVQRKKKHH